MCLGCGRTRAQPGQLFPFSQWRLREWTPPPHSVLHLVHEPQGDQKMGWGQDTPSLQNLSSRLGPTHTRPPCLGEGLLQVRWRSSKPVPQVVLHCPHDDQGVQPPFLEQLDTSIVGPWQFFPPQRGAGLSHDLERHRQELTPSAPSSLLHGCHGAQGPKPPLAVWFRSGHTVMFWLHWLMLELSSRVVHRRCFRSQPQ